MRDGCLSSVGRGILVDFEGRVSADRVRGTPFIIAINCYKCFIVLSIDSGPTDDIKIRFRRCSECLV